MLKELRKKAGLKQEDVAKKLGLSIYAISLYESNKRQPRFELIPKFAEMYGVTIEEIVYCFIK